MRFIPKSRSVACTLCLCLFVSAVPGCLEAPDIDEVGGVIYVFALCAMDDDTSFSVNDDLKRSMIAVVKTRLDPTGELGIRVSFNQSDELEIAVPGHDPQLHSRIPSRVTSPGKLEFLMLVNQTDHADLIEEARHAASRVVRVEDVVVGRWVKAQNTTPSGTVEYRGLTQDESILRDGASGKPVTFSADERIRATGNQFVLQNLMKEKGVADLEVLVAVDADPTKTLLGKHLAAVSQSSDSVGQPCISFWTTSEGARILEALTRANLPDRQTGLRRKLGIILDDVLLSAPAIMSPIGDAGQITGNFTEDDVRFIVNVLNSGELPVPLEREPVRVVDVPGKGG
jgi:preprotein translocase subunit SecD